MCYILYYYQRLTILARCPHLFPTLKFDKNAAPPYMECQPLLFFTKGLYDLASSKAHAIRHQEGADAPGPSGWVPDGRGTQFTCRMDCWADCSEAFGPVA